MLEKFAISLGKIYPFVWPIAFIVMGFITVNEPHIHFNLFGAHLTAHNLMWFMMALAHADIFWRGWCARHGTTN